LPLEPDPKLLALPDPLDPNIPQDIPKLFDAVLFNRHYYLYHGAAPAVMLFVPWRLLSGHDLPEGFALFLLCFGGYLFAAGTLVTITRMTWLVVSPWILAVMLLALGFCQSIPFLLNRVWVYEIAIGGGYFCISAGLFFLVRSLQSPRLVWPVASGLMFGMAVACRPHLVIVTLCAALAAACALRRRLPAFIAPLLMVGALIGLYNVERFGNPFDFGLNYQITGPFQGRLRPGAGNMLPGLYYMLFSRPEFTRVFPWVLIPWPPRSVPRPPLYFVEPIVGAFFLAPFLPMAFATPFMRKLGTVRYVLLLSASGILFFLITTGLSTQRYEVDFLPLLVLAALAGFVFWIASMSGWRRVIACSLLTLTVAFGLVVNLALGITGPYDELMKNKPLRYVRIAKWLSPVERFRPQLNPPISAHFAAPVRNGPDHLRQDLLLAGRSPWRYELFLDHLNGKPVLVSRFGRSDMSREVEPAAELVPFQVTYAPETLEMVVTASGTEVFRHKIDALITAPVQILQGGGS
jgi:hypothetical protein